MFSIWKRFVECLYLFFLRVYLTHFRKVKNAIRVDLTAYPSVPQNVTTRIWGWEREPVEHPVLTYWLQEGSQKSSQEGCCWNALIGTICVCFASFVWTRKSESGLALKIPWQESRFFCMCRRNCCFLLPSAFLPASLPSPPQTPGCEGQGNPLPSWVEMHVQQELLMQIFISKPFAWTDKRYII